MPKPEAVMEEILTKLTSLTERFDALESRLPKKPADILVDVRTGRRQCERGHQMQISDDYCQHCDLEAHPRGPVRDRYKAPRVHTLDKQRIAQSPEEREAALIASEPKPVA